MGKRKLRGCTNCGGRHGPPTGKMCTRQDANFAEKSEEMSSGKEAVTTEAPNSGLEAHLLGATSQEGNDWVFPDYPDNAEPVDNFEESRKKFDFVSPLRQPAMRADVRTARNGDMEDNEPRRPIGLTRIEMLMSDRMMRVENTMVDMAAAQKEQMEKLVR